MNIDTRLTLRFHAQARSSRWARRAAEFAAGMLIWYIAGFVTAFWIVQDADGFCGACLAQLVLIVLIPWATTLVIASLIRRARPFRTHRFDPLIRLAFETPSFPSGHSTLAFALAGATWGTLLFPFVFLAALLVALGRVAVGVHYVSDVLAGGVIGVFIALLVRAVIGLG